MFELPLKPMSGEGLAQLAPYACSVRHSRGRRFFEPDAPDRNAFQRDRDRIVHCTAFRRLVYKTQVFLNHEGDLFRTRLTHSLEVAQLGRTMARSLGLHEDLVEALALAHDLGHTPFGHAGQDALDACMQSSGGFEHNLQSLRVVDVLEQRYPAFDGLNLTFEAREGILKHCSLTVARHMETVQPDGPARRFIEGWQPSLEAQLCNLADEIAYNTHDIDDGMRSGLLTWDTLLEVPLLQQFHTAVLADHPQLEQQAPRRLLFEVLRRLLSSLVHDVLAQSRALLAADRPEDPHQARLGPRRIAQSEALRAECTTLKRFLFRTLYRHPRVMETTERGKQVVRSLFAAYVDDPRRLPREYAERPDLYRAVCDYISGMTDRFAVREHVRLTGQRLFD